MNPSNPHQLFHVRYIDTGQLFKVTEKDWKESSGSQRNLIWGISDETAAHGCYIRRYQILRVCKHCKQIRVRHATDGKCLFGSTSYEVEGPA